MVYALIVCRSLTYAQRAAAVLERSGISAVILRTPKRLTAKGCSYSVKISTRRLAEAKAALEEAAIRPQALFTLLDSGAYEEVPL